MNSKPSDSSQLSRRHFLGQASCSAVGSTALFSTLLNLKMASTAAAQSANNDYKALVCLFLAGGNDSFNMLVPRNGMPYQDYANIRRDLALSSSSLLPIMPQTNDGRDYGVHPGMPEIRSLFDTGAAAFVSNVGTLVEPVANVNHFENGARLPLGLFSHADQIMHWQSSIPDQRSAIGWAGRTADLLQSQNTKNGISMNISLSGRNVFQAGNQTVEYVITPNGSVGPRGYGSNEFSAIDALRTSAVDSLMDMEYKHLFEKTFRDVTKGGIDAHETFKAATGNVNLATQFSPGYVSQSMKMIAKTIAANQALGMKRQIFFVLFGGWDHHDEVLNAQTQMLPVVSKGMSELYNATVELGLQDSVTSFTASDFARTLTSNGQGSDHGWGGNHIVVGGGVRGQNIYGTYPDLAAGNSLDTGRGRLIPTTSVDEYFAELALWFGVSPSDLPTVFPNINRFYNPNSSATPVGFL